MQPTRPEDALLTDAFADFLEKCRAKNLSEKTLNIYTVHFKFFREYLSDPDKKASDITEDTLEGFILYLQNRGCNDITVQSYMRGVRCFCYYLMEEGYLQRFKIKLPKADKRIKETYTDTELKKLLKKPNVKTCEFNEYKTWVFSNYLLATGNRISTVLSLQIHFIQKGCINRLKEKRCRRENDYGKEKIYRDSGKCSGQSGKQGAEEKAGGHPSGNDSAVSNLPYKERILYSYPQNKRKTGSLQFERQSAENQAQKYVQG